MVIFARIVRCACHVLYRSATTAHLISYSAFQSWILLIFLLLVALALLQIALAPSFSPSSSAVQRFVTSQTIAVARAALAATLERIAPLHDSRFLLFRCFLVVRIYMSMRLLHYEMCCVACHREKYIQRYLCSNLSNGIQGGLFYARNYCSFCRTSLSEFRRNRARNRFL